MARWEPNAEGRLRDAAMELYLERGYEQTTVAGIAERAGLTSRTFFRYFADKREVLFAGSQELEREIGRHRRVPRGVRALAGGGPRAPVDRGHARVVRAAHRARALTSRGTSSRS